MSAEKLSVSEVAQRVTTTILTFKTDHDSRVPKTFAEFVSAITPTILAHKMQDSRLFSKTDPAVDHLFPQLGWFSADLYLVRVLGCVVDRHYTALKAFEDLGATTHDDLSKLLSLFEQVIKDCDAVLQDVADGKLSVSDILSHKLEVLANALRERAKVPGFRGIVFATRMATCVILGALINLFPQVFPAIKHGVLLGGGGASVKVNAKDKAEKDLAKSPMMLGGLSDAVSQDITEQEDVPAAVDGEELEDLGGLCNATHVSCLCLWAGGCTAPVPQCLISEQSWSWLGTSDKDFRFVVAVG